MTPAHSAEKVIELLIRATAEIPEQYFRLPIAGKLTGEWRERVYCYELYHQLRPLLEGIPSVSLAGEVDKAGHPLFSEPELENKKPDLIVHSVGSMENNLVVIEVKQAKALDGVKKDLRTLRDFKEVAGYEAGCLLLFGPNETMLDDLNRKAEEVGVSLRDFYVLHHAQAEQGAIRL
jgi:hypothetical protein